MCLAKAASPARACCNVATLHAVLGDRLPSRPGAQPRPAGRRAGALRRGERCHADRARAREHSPMWPRPPAPLDARRLATAALSAAQAAPLASRPSTAGSCWTTCAARWWHPASVVLLLLAMLGRGPQPAGQHADALALAALGGRAADGGAGRAGCPHAALTWSALRFGHAHRCDLFARALARRPVAPGPPAAAGKRCKLTDAVLRSVHRHAVSRGACCWSGPRPMPLQLPALRPGLWLTVVCGATRPAPGWPRGLLASRCWAGPHPEPWPLWRWPLLALWALAPLLGWLAHLRGRLAPVRQPGGPPTRPHTCCT